VTVYNLKEKEEQADVLKDGIECELCKEKFDVSLSTRYICITADSFVIKIKANRLHFASYIVFFLFSMVMFVFMFSHIMWQLSGIHLINLLFICMSFLFLVVVLLFAIYYFIAEYCLERELRLERFEGKSARREGQSRISPESVLELA
jgi:ABC-type uncharacterized transport system fused permease/ATPase subunit